MISPRPINRFAIAFASACLLAWPGYGQTVITRTAGFGGAGTITTTGTTTIIPANAGVQNGANLFHSFSQFDVAAGDMATFTGAGKTGAVNNVIARIFSASPSQINGGITVDAATLAGANLFLINPKGVIFGANSSVSVPGDFVTSTSDYITLSDGVNTGFFYADPTASGNTTLSNSIMAAPVSAFGFLKGQSLTAGITVNGGANLAVGGSLQFVTGNFTATSGSTLSVTKAATPLGIFAGSQTSSTADGVVPYLTGSVANYASEANFTQHGAINLGDSTGGASVTSTGTGGSVVIRGGALVQAGGATSLTKAAKSVAIQADSFTLKGTVQTTSATGTIGIDTSDSTGTVSLVGGTITSAGTITMGASALGGLSLDSASTISQTAGGGALSLTSTGTITNAGTISTTGSSTLRISTLGLVVNGGTISSGTGALGIDATGATSLTTVGTTGGTITSAGGAITMGATSLLDLTLDSLSSITETAGTNKTLSITSTGTVTNGGTISTTGANKVAISAASVSDSGTISTVTGALGIDTTGDTTLTAGTITSAGGAITIGQTSLHNLVLDSTSAITQTVGTAPTLTLKVTGQINNGGTISTVGGEALTVNAASLLLTGTLTTATGALNVNTTGTTTLTGGTILSAGAITLGNTALGGLVIGGTSTINSTGSTVTVTTPGNLTMTGGMLETTSTGGTRAGNVTVNVTTGNIALSGGAEIASISSGSGGSGNVLINPGVQAINASKNLTIIGTGVAAYSNGTQAGQAAYDLANGAEAPNTGIFSIANGTGAAGDVSVNAVGGVALSAGGQIASIQTNASGGNAGSVQITLNPDFFFLTNGGALTVGGVTATEGTIPVTVPIIFTNSTNKTSSSGAVTINALSSTIELQPGASIQSSTQDGRAGDVSVFGAGITMDPYTDIQSVEFQVSGDNATTGRTGNVLVEAFNFNIATFTFGGPVSIADTSLIQTLANPKSTGFDPVGSVQVFANTLSEGGTGVPLTGGTNVPLISGSTTDYDYKSVGATQILAVNNFTLNGANGVDVTGAGKVRVENVLNLNTDTSTPTTTLPSAGNGIVLDGTLNGSRTGVPLAIAAVVDDSGNSYTYTIDEGDGTLVGSNLFLSFSQFNLGFNTKGPVPETAIFDAPGTSNIIARITGGSSRIDGTLAEAMGTNANLFLVNSAGIVFTTHATLDLNGALTISTADSLVLNGGGVFSAAPNAIDNLIAPGATLTYDSAVESFVFGTTAQPNKVPAGVSIQAAQLANVSSGSGQIQIIAGPVALSSGAIVDSSQTFLFSTASTGTLTFTSGNSLATFPTSITSASSVVQETNFGALGAVTMASGSVLTVPSPNIASTILVRGQSFSLTNSLIVDQTTAQDNSIAGAVLVDVNGGVSITSTSNSSSPSFITTSALGDEPGGSVVINAASLNVSGSSAATTGILSTAEPSRYYTSDAGYLPFSYPGVNEITGNAGSVTLNISGTIALSNFGQISTNTTGSGNAGTITIRGPAGSMPQVSVTSGAQISSSANIDLQNHGAFTRAGAAGTVNLNASALRVDGVGSAIVSSAGTAIATGATGPGGNINITIDGATGLGAGATSDIVVSNSGQVSASSFNTSVSGIVRITQRNSTDLVVPALALTTNGGLYVTSGGAITTAENGAGTPSGSSSASVLQLNVQALTVDGGSVTSSTLGASNAGAIQIASPTGGTSRTDFVLVKNGGVISSNTGSFINNVSLGSNGQGGTITINTGALTVTGANSAISTSSAGSSIGSGGSVTLTTRGNPTVLGATGDVLVASGGTITASSDTVGQAGNIEITQSNSLDLADPATNPTVIGGVYVNGGTISTEANGAGTTSLHPNVNPGAITINTQALSVYGANSSIISDTLGASKAGNITIDGATGGNAQFVMVAGSGGISSATAGSGAGGTVLINTGALTVSGTGIISTATVLGTGNGGNVMLNVTGNANVIGSTGDVKVTNSGSIAAFSTDTGSAGTVTITQKGSTDLLDPAANPASVGGIDIDNAGSISTAALGTGVVNAPGSTAGDITLNTQALTMTLGSSITSSTIGLSRAGAITVNGTTVGANTQWVAITGGSSISSGTAGSGAGGAITINTGALTVDGHPTAVPATAITTSATGGTGNGGSITLNVAGNMAIVGATGDVELINGGTISASSDTTGDAGTVTITQVGSRDLVYPTLTATTNGGLLLNSGTITTAANGPGNGGTSNAQAGDITLNTEAVTMTNGSRIVSSTAGASKAGGRESFWPGGQYGHPVCRHAGRRTDRLGNFRRGQWRHDHDADRLASRR